MAHVGASPLSETERRFFGENGYLVREGVFSPTECDRLCEALSVLIRERAAELCAEGDAAELDFWSALRRSASRVEVFVNPREGSPLDLAPELWERRVMRVGHALHLIDGEFARACRSARICHVFRELLTPPPRLLQSAVIYKQPHDGDVQFGMHQDSSYLPAEPDSLMLAFVALDDADETNGCLRVVPGSHHGEREVTYRLGDGGYEPLDGVEPRAPPAADVALPVTKGSVVWAAGRTKHASGPNRSDRPRRALIVHALGADARLHPECWLRPPPGGFDAV